MDFEQAIALHLAKLVELELKRLKRRVTEERVHKSRVSLRRWFSVWSIMQDDGWESKKFRKTVIKPLKKLLAELGEVRDFDVNIDLAKSFGCDKSLIRDFARKRRRARHALESSIKSVEPKIFAEEMLSFLLKRGKKLKAFLAQNPSLANSPYTHFDSYLTSHEQQVQESAKTANSSKALHQLRLSIKHWRYLLSECLGLSSRNLVMSQQLLGDIHDLDRFELILDKLQSQHSALKRLKTRRKQLLRKFELYRHELPYGLRPGMRSQQENVR